MSEIDRAGIVSIPRGQGGSSFQHWSELNNWYTYRLTILSQALRRILQPLINEIVISTRAFISETFPAFKIWSAVALLFLVIAIIFPVGFVARKGDFDTHTSSNNWITLVQNERDGWKSGINISLGTESCCYPWRMCFVLCSGLIPATFWEWRITFL